MTVRQAETIISLANNNLNMKATAREMFVHYHTVIYNIKMIRRNTGLDPLNIRDLNDLLRKAHAVLEGEHEND
jgi:DNA-binding PucR family transcriptional regulator